MVRVIERQDRGRKCPAAIFTPRQTDVSLGPLGKQGKPPKTTRTFPYRTPKIPHPLNLGDAPKNRNNVISDTPPPKFRGDSATPRILRVWTYREPRSKKHGNPCRGKNTRNSPPPKKKQRKDRVNNEVRVATFRRSYRATPAWMTPVPKLHSSRPPF